MFFKLITALLFLMLFTNQLYSQDFSATTGASGGLEIDDAGNFTQVQGTFTVEPQTTIGDKFTVSVVALTLIKENLPKVYGGTQAGYIILKNPDRSTVAVTGRYLYGSAGAQLFGLGLDYNIDRTVINLNADWNYQNKTALVTAGINYQFWQ